MGRLARLLVAAFAFAAMPAGAVFHLWAMNELYSSADGSVQFLELTAVTGGQQFMAGHTLTSSSGGTTRSFTFPANLPGDTFGRRMLIGTQSFAALGVVSPDYVVPDGFFFPGGGTINFAEFSDVWNHGALPGGTLSLARNGSTGTNSPQNFAGQTGSVGSAGPPPPPPGDPVATVNVQALWWRAPANSESGWGVNITQQGGILFATWFTYDTDGSGLWLVMSDGRLVADNTWSGILYRTTGPAFSANPFDPTRVSVVEVGSATFAFTDSATGTFTYVVNGVSQTKPITRQVFSAPAATCFNGGAPGTRPVFQDLWWRSPADSERGWGVNITHQGDILFATWFTYGPDGRGMWLVVPRAERVGAVEVGDDYEPGMPLPSTFEYRGPLYRTTGPAFSASPWNPGQVVVTEVGSAAFAFTDLANGTFTYTLDGVTQSKPITRQVFASPASVCR